MVVAILLMIALVVLVQTGGARWARALDRRR